ncbi:Slp family lipoprotein [Vibrio parahaemolyticus]|uniref:Slp family lipoprotein n=1 Tax=Vibrio mediterranei TaxID=689 RepID=UPI0040695860
MRVLLGVLVVMLAGCSSGPDEVKVADESLLVSYSMAKSNPSAYVGEPARWGGVIAKLTNPTSTSSELQISQFELDSKHRPDETLQGSSRFVVKVERFLDPSVFVQGKPMTFVGEIEGAEVIEVGEQKLTVPVIKAVNYYLWTEDNKIKTYYVGDPYYDYYYDRYYYWDYVDDVDIIDHYDAYDYGDF